MGSRVESEAIYNVDHEFQKKYTAPKERKRVKVYRDIYDYRFKREKTPLESLKDFIEGISVNGKD